MPMGRLKRGACNHVNEEPRKAAEDSEEQSLADSRMT